MCGEDNHNNNNNNNNDDNSSNNKRKQKFWVAFGAAKSTFDPIAGFRVSRSDPVAVQADPVAVQGPF